MKKVLPLFLVLALVACQRAKEGAKDALNASGEIAGKAASEVLEGVATGVEETWDVQVELDPSLKERGVSLGRTTVISDNELSVYLIASTPITDTLMAVATEKDGLEMGRAPVIVALEAGMAGYFDVPLMEMPELHT